MRLKSTMIAIAIAFALPLGAFAQSGPDKSMVFKRLDTDGNGFVSLEEWNRGTDIGVGDNPRSKGNQGPGSSASGGAASADAWVIITAVPVEQEIMERQRRESLFRKLDQNADGVITAAEAGMNVELVNAFASLDDDRNAVIDRREFNRVHVEEGRRSSAGGR